MTKRKASEAAKIAAALADADADGNLVIVGSYYTCEYLRERGAILKPLRITKPTRHVLERTDG